MSLAFQDLESEVLLLKEQLQVAAMKNREMEKAYERCACLRLSSLVMWHLPAFLDVSFGRVCTDHSGTPFTYAVELEASSNITDRML